MGPLTRSQDIRSDWIPQYGEYKRGDIQPLREIHRERIKAGYDRETRQFSPFDCERSVFLGKIVSGDEKGTIVTVECFEGPSAPEVRSRVLY